MNDAFGISPVTAGRPTRTVSRNPIVATRVRTEGVGCADRNYRRLVGGRMDGTINLSAIRVLTVVAGSGNHHYARVNQSPRGATDWIVLVRTDRRGAETHVDDADVVLVFIKGIGRANRFGRICRANDPVQRSQESRSRAGSLRVQDAQVNDRRAGRDTLIVSAVRVTGRGGRRSHVTTVAVRIGGRVVLAGKVFTELYAIAAGRERVMTAIDAGVEYGYADAGAVNRGRAQQTGKQARGISDEVGTGRGRHVPERFKFHIGRDVVN